MKPSFIIPVIVLSLVLAACATRDAAAGAPSVDITLPARDAALKTGHALRREVIDGADSIGWWSQTDEEIRWALSVKETGEYSVTINLSCDDEFAGSRVKMAIDDRALYFLVPATGDWAAFRTIPVGKIILATGEHTIVLTASGFPSGFACNVRNVKFTK